MASRISNNSKKSINLKIEKFVIRYFKALNTSLFALLAILLLLDINKAWFRADGSGNFTLFISPIATGLVALFSILIPLQTQRREAMTTLSMSVTSELYRNLSEFEYLEQQFEKDYFKEDPETQPTEHDRQSMEMGKITAASQRLSSALEDTAYKGVMNNRIIAQIPPETARAIVEAYASISIAKQTTLHFADFFIKIFDGEKRGIAPSFIQNAREHKVDSAIKRVREDVGLAIKQINTATDALNKELEKYDLRQKPVYRDELLTKHNTTTSKDDNR